MRLAQAGDPLASNELARRVRELLVRVMHGRLPRRARDLGDTSDLIQSALRRAFEKLPVFISRGEWSFFAFAYRIANNLMLNQIRRAGRRPEHTGALENLSSQEPSPLEDAELADLLARYQAGLTALSPRDRRAIILLLERGLEYHEIAKKLGFPSPDAARMFVKRALRKLADMMGEERDDF
ncbi:MAG: sigma-70 family RNA polymerase sigma factor [Candidatus Eisenbacteria bacterium]